MNEFVVISGSHRASGISHALAATVSRLLRATVPDCRAEVVSIANVPYWDEGLWGDELLAPKWNNWHDIANRLKRADGLIVITPEYGGMVPPKLSNFLLLCSGYEIGHKPALAIAVSGTRGGSYPIAQLRSFGYKNNHLCWIPDHVIIRDLKDATLSGLGEESSYIRGYLVNCLQLLDQYATALKAVRMSGVADFERYPYGM